MAFVSIKSFLYYEHANVEYVLPHSHDLFEFVYYISGEGEVNYLGEKHRYRAGTVSIVEPAIKHDEAAGKPTNVYIVTFAVSSRIRMQNIFVSFKSEVAAKIKERLKTIENEFHSEGMYSRQICDALFESILYLVLREKHSNRSSVNDSRLAEEAKKYIKEHCTKNIDFERLAEKLGYSYHRFRHIFKDQVGVTLGAYLSEQRINLAKELLATTDLTVREIAERVGFSSQQYFINLFHEKVGTSPARYRQMCRAENPVGVCKFD